MSKRSTYLDDPFGSRADREARRAFIAALCDLSPAAGRALDEAARALIAEERGLPPLAVAFTDPDACRAALAPWLQNHGLPASAGWVQAAALAAAGRLGIGLGEHPGWPVWIAAEWRWNPFAETAEAARARIMENLTALLDAELERVATLARAQPAAPPPPAKAFRWLARYQYRREPFGSIARAEGISRETVRLAVLAAARRLGLPLRRPRTGRPRKRHARILKNPQHS